MKKRFTKQIDKIAKQQSADADKDDADAQDLKDAITPSGTDILRGEGQAGLIEGIHDRVYEIGDRPCRTV